MRSTFHGLETAKRGLYAQQTGIHTTAHNIANANTKGYTRQRVNFAASTPIEAPAFNRSVAPGQLGTGVDFSSIVRLREKFLDDQFRNEAHSSGYWHVQKDTLEKIEMLMNEPSDEGLRTSIDLFWNAWSDLSREPDNMTARAVVRERALAMLDAFKHVDNKLEELTTDLKLNFTSRVTAANRYLEQIAQLNKEIRRLEGMGMNANDLRDQRDLLVDELAALVPIKVTEENEEGRKGMYLIKLAYEVPGNGGATEIVLVDGITHHPIQPAHADADPNAADPADQPNEIYLAITTYGRSGELYGIWAAINETLPSYREELKNLFNNIVQAVNQQHGQGYDLYGEPGENFFVLDNVPGSANGSFTVENIHDVVLNDLIGQDLKKIAAALSHDEDENGDPTGLMGDGENALRLSQLRDQFNEEYRTLIGRLGVQTENAQRQAHNAQVVKEVVESRRQSVSGVSLDEEMVNLVQLQHAYNASARMVTAIDQMLDLVINRMGIVGR